MRKWIALLGALCALQIVVIAIGVFGNGADNETQDKLIQATPDKIDRIVLQARPAKAGTDEPVEADSKGSGDPAEPAAQLVLLRDAEQEDQWRLADWPELPLDQSRVDGLLRSLAEVEPGWPVAQTEGAAARFEVAEQNYERRIELHSGERSEILFVGSAPGLRKRHVRTGDDSSIFSVELDVQTLSTLAADWLDREQVYLDPAKITRIETPAWTVVRQESNWMLVDVAQPAVEGGGEGDTASATDPDAMQRLLGRLSRPAITGVSQLKAAGTSAEADHGQRWTVEYDSRKLVFEWHTREQGIELLRDDLQVILHVADSTGEDLLSTESSTLAARKPDTEETADEAAESGPDAANDRDTGAEGAAGDEAADGAE